MMMMMMMMMVMVMMMMVMTMMIMMMMIVMDDDDDDDDVMMMTTTTMMMMTGTRLGTILVVGKGSGFGGFPRLMHPQVLDEVKGHIWPAEQKAAICSLEDKGLIQPGLFSRLH